MRHFRTFGQVGSDLPRNNCRVCGCEAPARCHRHQLPPHLVKNDTFRVFWRGFQEGGERRHARGKKCVEATSSPLFPPVTGLCRGCTPGAGSVFPEGPQCPLDIPSGEGEAGRAEGSPWGSPAVSRVIPCLNLSHFFQRKQKLQSRSNTSRFLFCPIPPGAPSGCRSHPGLTFSPSTLPSCSAWSRHCFPALLKRAGTPKTPGETRQAEG